MSASAAAPIPAGVEELTPEWFTRVLARDPAGSRVTAVSTEALGGQVGFMGSLWRCRLGWEPAGAGPASVVVKLPGPPGPNRSLGESLRVFEREIAVYRDLAADWGLPTPAFLHGAHDPGPPPGVDRAIEWAFDHLPLAGVQVVLGVLLAVSGRVTRRSVLVIADVADARPPAQLAGGTLDDVAAGLGVLARFHAANWRRRDLDRHPLVWSLDRTPAVARAAYRRNRDAFVARFGPILGPHRIARMDATQRDADLLVRHLASPPWTLLHGDYRLDNLLFRPDGSIVVVDHQGTGRGRPGWDVAYFVTTALDADHRHAEGDLLAHYHDTLVAHGVTDHPLGDLVADVACAKQVFAHRMVAGDALLDTALDETGTSFVDEMVERLAGWLD